MERVKHLTRKAYHHSFVRYVVTGGTTFALDFFGLIFLHGILKINVIVAASVSYWVSIAFNFVVNRYWTFGAEEKRDLARHLVLYLFLLGFNYLFTVVFLAIATHAGMHYTIAKVVAVAIQMTWTYVAYKKVIFK